jgi:phosphoglycerate kinase
VSKDLSLEAVGLHLAEALNKEVVFVDDYSETSVQPVVSKLREGQFILLENLRFHKEETANDQDFSRRLADGFDFYINDAFGTCHRAHASTAGIPEQLLPEQRAAGLLVQKEIQALSGLNSAKAPFVVVMGGSKVSDKMGVILNLLDKCNHLIIGGAMAYTFLKYKGISVGNSRVENDKMDLVELIYNNADRRAVKIHLPVDHVVAGEFSQTAPAKNTDSSSIEDGMMGLDIGVKSAKEFAKIIEEAGTVLWNGPMGVFEWENYSHGSMAVANAMAACEGQTVIGGGDSVAAVNMAGVGASMSHISTGGGAALEFLEGKTLPGIKVLHV